MLSDNLPDWPRRFYQRPGGKPFMFYVVFGAFPGIPALSRQEYRSDGVFPGLQLSHYDRLKHTGVLERFCEGYPWEELNRHNPALARDVQAAGECLVLRGELGDQSNLNYLRDTVGLLTALLDHGGVVLYDPWRFHWWPPEEWRDRVFRPGGPVPGQHVVILTSEEPESASLTWCHSRGMRKFGRPDLSVRRVPPRFRDAVIDLFERFIEIQAFGGSVRFISSTDEAALRGIMSRNGGEKVDPARLE